MTLPLAKCRNIRRLSIRQRFPPLEKLGVPVRVLRSEKTYTSVFMGKVTRGPKKDMIRSFPVCGKCYVQRDCKMHPIRQYQKTLPSNTVQYIGIAKNEPQRLARLRMCFDLIIARFQIPRRWMTR